MDVPLIAFVAVSEVYHEDVMLEPGAKMSRQAPKFEYDARASPDGVAPTVSPSAVRDGGGVAGVRVLVAGGERGRRRSSCARPGRATRRRRRRGSCASAELRVRRADAGVDDVGLHARARGR